MTPDDQSLRGFLATMEKTQPDQILRIRESVSRKLEMTSVVFELDRIGKSPVVVFENVAGSEMPVVTNIAGSRKLLAGCLGVDVRDLPTAFRERCQTYIPCEVVDKGAWDDIVIEGDDVDLTKLPIPFQFSVDAAPYITAGQICARDPETGVDTTGFHRLMLRGKNRLGISLHSRRRMYEFHRRAEVRGEALPAAIVIGTHPLHYMGSMVYAYPPHVRKYEIIGGLFGKPYRLARCGVGGLEVPAGAEIVIEGEILANVHEPEGPFGEFTGYYAGGQSEQPVIRVQRIYHRNDPILTMATPMRPPSDFSYSKCVMKAGMIWDEVERAGVSGVKGVWCHEAGGARMFNVIAIKQAYAGHAKQAATAAASCQSGSYLGRFVVVVDEDIDPTNLFEVLWAMCTRCDPAEDIDILRKMWSGPLDPRIPRGSTWNSRAVIDACRPYEMLADFPPVARATPELRAKVEAKFRDVLSKL